ncbi:MAG: hypothetical protein JRE40_02330 [Deltaproteobacteria bacterium]|nr:hypothetical protein [Deltaproteobacteria bacterium]
MSKRPKQPKTLEDLKPAPYNPRTITPEAAAGLRASIKTFGDLSGIVWNSRTGHLVAGHQRKDALIAQSATFQPDPPALVLPSDEAFPIRIVDWDTTTEKAANITANNPHISGEFTGDLQDCLEEVRDFDDFDDLRLDDLTVIGITDIPDGNKSIDEDLLAKTNTTCPKCGFAWMK